MLPDLPNQIIDPLKQILILKFLSFIRLVIICLLVKHNYKHNEASCLIVQNKYQESHGEVQIFQWVVQNTKKGNDGCRAQSGNASWTKYSRILKKCERLMLESTKALVG